jgi:hypothetical protein
MQEDEMRSHPRAVSHDACGVIPGHVLVDVESTALQLIGLRTSWLQRVRGCSSEHINSCPTFLFPSSLFPQPKPRPHRQICSVRYFLGTRCVD